MILVKSNHQTKKRYYIIGIGGVAMGNLAILLKQKGHDVVGSDQAEMYEPMKSLLQDAGIKVLSPFNALHVKRWKSDIVIVGNAISRGNPELEYIMSNGQVYRSVSDILREEFIEGKKAVVVTGTHGKTTTSALVAWILEYAGLDPTIFVGGFMRNISGGAKLGKGEYVVIEGDEYSTVFFDKNPKFFGYRPFIGIVNNIELDHVDIYDDIEHLKKTFALFSKLIPQNGLLVLNGDDKNVNVLLPAKSIGSKLWKNIKPPNTSTFDIEGADYSADTIKTGSKMTFHVKYHDKYVSDISTSLIGRYNINNILAAISVARFIKIPFSLISKAISTFEGVKRRSEIIYDKNGIIVIDDYAHHPTAVRETLVSLRNKFHGKRLIALFEPGSASSKKRIFENEYLKAFRNADIVFLYKPYKASKMNKSDVFSGKTVAKQLINAGVDAKTFEDVDNLLFHVKSISKSGDVIIIMACRGFDGLRERIVKEL